MQTVENEMIDIDHRDTKECVDKKGVSVPDFTERYYLEIDDDRTNTKEDKMPTHINSRYFSLHTNSRHTRHHWYGYGKCEKYTLEGYRYISHTFHIFILLLGQLYQTGACPRFSVCIFTHKII